MVDFYYMDSSWFKISDMVSQMEKTTPKCLKAIIIQDRKCNPILPKPQLYNPTQKYKNIGISIIGDGTALARKTYSPKLVAFLNNLV